ncbi:cystathionine gamma-lyase [Cryptosporangium aurantiacum]|uniref:Cystathionine gamma-lyase n=1 Tax=Cryptosporangium aurantiacum TaxID=134849 RepID=A0A1M7HR13_9ACTN|nr:cystathionine gamma-lyase [Cryptosporangium aurantiacum]SHM30860.1 cystathionine gamma-lyase [Cryptosporangium aurantiacum]
MSTRSTSAAHGDGTVASHAGERDAVLGEPARPGPVLSSVFHLPPAPGGPALDGYGRPDNPTYRDLERAFSELEGGTKVTAFASGMAAISAVLFGLLKAGDTVVIPSDGYYATRPLAADRLAAFGVTVRTAPTLGPYPVEGATLLLLETPSNPGMDVCDLPAVCAAARAAGALVAVDNTTATPLGQRPLDLGADLVVASDTKALAGHGDLLLGHVSTRDDELAAKVRQWRTWTGSIPGPFEAWLALRSLATLDVRLARQAANALAVAELLSARPEVTAVRYPGLPGDPAHEVAVRQMRRFGGVLSAELPDAAFVERMLAASRLASAVTSFGDVRTGIDRRAQWGGDDVPDGFVRISCGIEDTEDLLADLKAALDAAVTAG